MSLDKRLSSLVGSVGISRNTSLNDLGGALARINNITGAEQLAIGVNSGDYVVAGLLQTTLNERIQFGGDDVTTETIPVGGEIAVPFTNLFDARLIGHTFRLNQGRIRFHVDVQDFESNLLRIVDGNVDMDDIDFANATGPDNDVVMVYKNTFVRYTEQQDLIVTFYNVGDEDAIVRGGPISSVKVQSTSSFVPFWETNYYDITATAVIPNGYIGVATEFIKKGEAVYISGLNTDIPTKNPEMSLADNSDPMKRPAVAIASADVNSGEKGFFSYSGIIRDLDTSGFSQNDTLYLGVNGDLVNTAPADYVQSLAIVTVSDTDQGNIQVNISNASEDAPSDGFGYVRKSGAWALHENTVTIDASPYSVTTEDILYIDVNTIGADATINLPPAADRLRGEDGAPIGIVNIGTFLVNVSPDGLETIQSEGGLVLPSDHSVTLSPISGGWRII